MVTIKEMPVKEKYTLLLENIKQDSFTPVYIEKNLGVQTRAAYEEECRKASIPIPGGATEKEKYEIEYATWVSSGGIAFDFIRKQAGEEGLRQFIKADVEKLKRANAGPALFFLQLIKSVAPGVAFKMLAKRMAYQLQWITDYSVTELSRDKVVMEISHCKVLDYPGGEGSCIIGCQKIYGIWLAEQFRLDMKTRRKGFSCTFSIAPMK